MREDAELQEWQIEKINQGIQQADAGEFATDEEVAAVFERYRAGFLPPGRGRVGSGGRLGGGSSDIDKARGKRERPGT